MPELREIFDIQYGNQLALNKQKINNHGINFVSRSSNNLGISCQIEQLPDINPFSSGLISVSLGGSILEAFIQPNKFYTGQGIKVLTPKISLTYQEKMYYCLCIKKNAYRYTACGREATKTLDYIKIPEIDEIPSYINKIRINKPNKKSLSDNSLNLKDRQWKYFYLKDIFDIETGKYYDIDSFEKGNVPLISAKDKNNGVKDWTNLTPIYPKGITIGKVEMASNFQTIPFFITSDACVIKKDILSDFAYLFVNAVLKKERYRWSYGRQIRLQDTKDTKIKLPVDNKGNPDWQFMEDYIKSLPYSSNL